MSRSNKTLRLYDRQGILVDAVSFQSEILDFEWEPNGAFLAVINYDSQILSIWESENKATIQIDTSTKALSILRWNVHGDCLALGTAQGNVVLYSPQSKNLMPILGKHSKAITSMLWTADNIVICGSGDKTISLTNVDGDTIQRTLQISSLIHQGMEPTELTFHAKYGSIVDYSWFGDRMVLIGFQNGYAIVISTDPEEVGHEKVHCRVLKEGLVSMAVDDRSGKVAFCGGNHISIHDISELKEVVSLIQVDQELPNSHKLGWSDDGRFLTLATKSGFLYTYLASLPVLGGASNLAVAYRSSLREVSIKDFSLTNSEVKVQEKSWSNYSVDTEPDVIAIGPSHLAIAEKKQAWYHLLESAKYSTLNSRVSHAKLKQEPTLGVVIQKVYPDEVKTMSLNHDMVAVLLSNGQLHVHALKGTATRFNDSQNSVVVFPENSAQDKYLIDCALLTPDFLIVGTRNGFLRHISIDNYTLLNEFQHSAPITTIFPDPKNSTKVIFIDRKQKSWLLNAVSNDCLTFEASANMGIVADFQMIGALWDHASSTQICTTFDDSKIITYAFLPNGLRGPKFYRFNDVTKLPHGWKPVLCMKNCIHCLAPGGKLTTLELNSHKAKGFEDVEGDEWASELTRLYLIGKLTDIWSLMKGQEKSLDIPSDSWHALAAICLQCFDTTSAARIHRFLGDFGMVMFLEELDTADDKNYYWGHLAMAIGEWDMAQDLYLASRRPLAALELRRDLLQWEQALSLASSLSPADITVISKEYAQQLEINGSNTYALQMYSQALKTISDFPGTWDQRQDHEKTCLSGLTRMTFRMGDIVKGMKMIPNNADKQLLFECGTIMESLKQYREAAIIYERGEWMDKAAENHLLDQNLNRLFNILDRITSARVCVQLGQALEAQRRYQDAAKAYQKAKAWDYLVAVYVTKLQQIADAVTIVRKTRSRESAKLIADFFVSINDYKSVVEFYVLSNMNETAFNVALSHKLLDVYVNSSGDRLSTEEMLKIASIISDSQPLLAGKLCFRAGDYVHALQHFLHARNGESLELAIKTVGAAKDDHLTGQLINWLMMHEDEADTSDMRGRFTKDPKWIFKLYMGLGQFVEAARTAMIIAREEWAAGNYRTAHDLLLDNFRQLRQSGNYIPSQMENMLMLLHSYILVKVLVRNEAHEKGARMLIRVAHNISRFPSHIIPILTSTVIECQRAGLRKSAFEFAAVLMRPENRNRVDSKYRKKIEQIVRRPDIEEPPEAKSPCPYCSSQVTDTTLECEDCQNGLPYCIATGRHIVTTDYTTCPHCLFPALFSELTKLIDKTGTCPMCSNDLQISDLTMLPAEEAECILRDNLKREKEREQTTAT
ncbi:WD repeat domain 19, isoform CRA_b [Paraphysoderma sedebokerense]|nr:WD repeat domain 19, isoform CRA_b [Paraphysoderma sedebokerense]